MELLYEHGKYFIWKCCNPDHPYLVTCFEWDIKNKCKLFDTFEEAQKWVMDNS